MFVADDAWRHVAATRDASGALAVYIDGEKRAGCEGTGVPSSNNFHDLSIGCTFGTIGPPPGPEPPIWFFPGLIDEPAMWNEALSEAQIADIFNTGIDPLSTGLVGFWTFDEGTGQAVADLSQAGNDGFRGETPDVDSADPSWDDKTPVSIEDLPIPSYGDVTLAANYPNPFYQTTQIQFSLPQSGDIRLAVLDLLGREIDVLAKGWYPAGTYTVTANMESVSSGSYLYQLDTPTARLTGKMLLIK